MKTNLPRRAVLAMVTLGMLVTTAIAGCVPGAPAPSPSVTGASDASSPTPTSTATASAETPDAGGPLASRVIIFSGLLGAVDASENSIGLLDMFEPVASIDPVVDEISGYFGFELLDWDLPASRTPAMPEFVIRSTASDVRGVRVESVDGITVGDSMATLEATFPGDSRRQRSGEFTEQIVVRLDEMDPVEGRFAPVSFAVRLAGPVGGDVEEIFSPYPDMQI